MIARSGAGMGRAVITPTHNSLLSDYYPPEVRADVFGFHAIGLAAGALLGPALGGLLGGLFGWRVPFYVFVVPTRRVRDPRHPAARAGPRPLRTRRGGRERRQ